MEQNEINAALKPLLNILEQLDIPYYICGSLASSIYGIARSTQDVDLVSDLKIKNAEILVKYLSKDYFITEEMIIEAVKNKSSFNIIHLDTMIKIDVFILKDNPFHRSSLERINEDTIDAEDQLFKVKIISAEDVILSKLHWYKSGNEISERQWLDILGVIKIQESTLDKKYLKKWAEYLDVYELLHKAFSECGIKLI